MNAIVDSFFDRGTNTISHVLADSATSTCAIIDPVLAYDPTTGRTNLDTVAAIESLVAARGYSVAAILETHAHADHLSAAQHLRRRFDAPVGIGEHIRDVQDIFAARFNLGEDFARDGSQFDWLLSDNQSVSVGELEVRVMHTPGHTPACVTYVCEDVAFVGDTLFMPDYGTARCDFPGGSAAQAFESISRILALPAATQLYLCHDYLPDSGRTEHRWQVSVAEQREHNVHVGGNTTAADFIAQREARDQGLSAPKLLLPAIQVNIRAGHFPPAEANGVAYLKIPIT